MMLRRGLPEVGEAGTCIEFKHVGWSVIDAQVFAEDIDTGISQATDAGCFNGQIFEAL